MINVILDGFYVLDRAENQGKQKVSTSTLLNKLKGLLYISTYFLNCIYWQDKLALQQQQDILKATDISTTHTWWDRSSL